ncbi:MAG: hypothetical protein M1837_000827 [Sclerophora amabilis]|nr:MAG: hypothetical protein M1837_000827 [Sclerophora amabilis]
MSILRLALPALAVAGAAIAQNSCSSSKINIQNSGDAEELANCQTIRGDVIIADTVTGDISLNGVSQIQGDLTCDGCANLTSLEADSLTRIGGDFLLNGLTSVGNLNFPSIQEVGSINWIALGPGLSSLSFGDTGVTKADSVKIDNTYLTALDGINLEQVDEFEIVNNNFLTKVEVQLYNVTKALTLSSNGLNLSASFPNLEWAFNMTFRNVSEIEFPSLARVNGSLGFVEGFYSSISAPNLTRLNSGSLTFVDNKDLTKLSFPQLSFIGGGFTIANNTKLDSIMGFPKVKTVNGAVDFNGNFTEASLPALSVVQGGFNAQSSEVIEGDDGPCTDFQDQKDQGIIRGRFVCKGEQEKPGSAGTTPTSSGSSPTNSGAAGQVTANALDVMGFSSIVAALLHLLL